MTRVEARDPALPAARMIARVEDYVALTKARVTALVLVTTGAGYYMGSTGSLDVGSLLTTLLGTGLVGAGAMALNQLLERDLDARMVRTAGRPLPRGQLGATEALAFGVASVSIGLGVLSLLVNEVAALVTAATVALYLFAYTPLKPRSTLSTVVGAVPGALPPVTGWAAATGRLDEGAWALFGIFFFWQLPHALAIARMYREDYAAAGIQVLPVVDRDGGSTGRQVVVHSLALLAASVLPTLVGLAGLAYLGAAMVLGVAFVGFALAFARSGTVAAARNLFLVSLLYVPGVLVALALDKSR